jgi:hypothetical protein
VQQVGQVSRISGSVLTVTKPFPRQVRQSGAPAGSKSRYIGILIEAEDFFVGFRGDGIGEVHQLG